MKQTAPSVSPMSNEARNSYVIEQITEALTGLLRTKPIGEVSISELCAAAGVGRASFYRNFESKEAVLQRKDEALLRQWQKDYDAAAAQAKAAGCSTKRTRTFTPWSTKTTAASCWTPF